MIGALRLGARADEPPSALGYGPLSPEVVRGRPCPRSTIHLDHGHAVGVILLFNLDRFAGPVAVALALSRPNTDVRHLSVAQV